MIQTSITVVHGKEESFSVVALTIVVRFRVALTIESRHKYKNYYAPIQN